MPLHDDIEIPGVQIVDNKQKGLFHLSWLWVSMTPRRPCVIVIIKVLTVHVLYVRQIRRVNDKEAPL